MEDAPSAPQGPCTQLQPAAALPVSVHPHANPTADRVKHEAMELLPAVGLGLAPKCPLEPRTWDGTTVVAGSQGGCGLSPLKLPQVSYNWEHPAGALLPGGADQPVRPQPAHHRQPHL